MSYWPLALRRAMLVRMGRNVSRIMRSLAVALAAVVLTAAPVVAVEVTLQGDTKGCTGVLPSTDGNTDMRLVGGTQTPGGTAIFEITYPLDASSIGKSFTITACAYIDDVATLKYLVSFVPSNQSFVLRMTFAVPFDAPVGGEYCIYAKTTRSPTAAQASQRKAGPACFIIRPPSSTATQPPRPADSSAGPTGPTPGTSAPPAGPGQPAGGQPGLPDTAMTR